MKTKVKLFDKLFAHTHTMSCGYQNIEPKHFVWYRGDDYCDISVFTDLSLDEYDNSDSKFKVALLMESPEVYPDSYKKIIQIQNKFDLVLTFNLELMKLIKNAKYYPLGGTWIKPKDWCVYNKTKLVSMIASNKTITSGHRMRHDIVEKFKDKIDIFGTINDNQIDYKLTGLKDYAFSIVVENTQCPGYYTEKLIDCFLTGTIPIFWGDLINTSFNVLNFYDLKDLENILNNICISKKFHDKYTYYLGNNVMENFFVSREYYWMPENTIWELPCQLN